MRKDYSVDFKDVEGQNEVIDFILIAAAGGHYMLMMDSPCCDRSIIVCYN